MDVARIQDELEPAWHPSRDLVAFTSDHGYQPKPGLSLSGGDLTTGDYVETEPEQLDLRFVYLAAPVPDPRLRAVTVPPYDSAHPDWTPDGRGVVYVRGQGLKEASQRLEKAEIWIRANFVKGR